MGQKMITGAGDGRSIRPGSTELAEGLGLCPGVIVDQHFLRRQRFNRLYSAVLDHPEEIGLGIDESTGVIWRDGIVEVVGTGSVLVIDARQAIVSQVDEAPNASEAPEGSRPKNTEEKNRATAKGGAVGNRCEDPPTSPRREVSPRARRTHRLAGSTLVGGDPERRRRADRSVSLDDMVVGACGDRLVDLDPAARPADRHPRFARTRHRGEEARIMARDVRRARAHLEYLPMGDSVSSRFDRQPSRRRHRDSRARPPRGAARSSGDRAGSGSRGALRPHRC